MFLNAGYRSDYLGAKAQPSSLPPAKALIADRGYDADWFRWSLSDWGIEPCIRARSGRKTLSFTTVPEIDNATASRTCSLA